LLAGLAVGFGAVAYRTYQRFRWYEQSFNSLLLDPYQQSAFPVVANDTLPDDETISVVFFGDSRADQWPSPDEKPGYVFINRGVDSQSSGQVAGRYNAHILPLEPDILVLQVGVNNLRLVTYFPDQKTEISDNLLANIREIVAKSREIETKVILVTIFPTGEASLVREFTGKAQELRETIQIVNDELMGMTGEGVIVLDSAVLLADDHGQLKEEYQLDELHLNQRGYVVLNGTLIETLSQLIVNEEIE